LGLYGGARQQLIQIELIAYQAPLYQVLALPVAAPRTTHSCTGTGKQVETCVFHLNLASDSTANRPPIPGETGHGFHVNLAT
jgi:hypothetical protein